MEFNMTGFKKLSKNKTYNLLMPRRDWEVLTKVAHDVAKRENKYTSVAQLMREAYRSVYYEELE